jgi:nucleoside-diphosphate-sugar epimerase
MHVLVSGAGGFTGQYAATELEAAGHRVTALASDLRDAAGLEAEVAGLKPDAVMHLAAQAFVGHDDASEFYQVNVVGTDNLLSSVAKGAPGVAAVLVASSANIYGNQPSGSLSEETVPAPANHYAISKLAMEYAVRRYFDKLPIVITRPFNYTGVGQNDRFIIPKIVGHFRRRASVIELGNIDVYREFGDVRRVARAYRQLLESPAAGEAINICTGQAHSLKQVLALCEGVTGHHIEVQVNPQFVRNDEVKSLSGDDTKLKRLVAEWEPVNLRDTIKWMLEAA